MSMMADIVDTTVPSTADLRKASVDVHRAKNRKARYKNVNMNLMGLPVDPVGVRWSTSPNNPNCPVWNDRNKFKMANPNARNCGCAHCIQIRNKSGRKSKGARLNTDDDKDFDYSTESVYTPFERSDPVFYSYDQTSGPSHGSQILSQALNIAIDKMETKQLETLVKNEYDIVYSEESASSEDDEYEFV